MRISRRLFSLTLASSLTAIAQDNKPAAEGAALREALRRRAADLGKPAWQAMLLSLADLHGRSVHPPLAHFPHAWEDIGPGYQGGRAFGHIDLTHERLDVVAALPEHVRNQTRNELAGQQADGLIPGVINFDANGKASWKNNKGFPPLWPVAVDAYVEAAKDVGFLRECLAALEKQIGWFETSRSLAGGGFYYIDVVQPTWESGMDEGIRYDERPEKPAACVDASSHVYLMYDHAARWSRKLDRPAEPWQDKASALRQFIQRQLWDAESGFFFYSM
jgi:putative isomerase